jgi:hypothetical protein
MCTGNGHRESDVLGRPDFRDWLGIYDLASI